MTARWMRALLVAGAGIVLVAGAHAQLGGPVGAQEEPAPTPTPVVTGNIPVVAISPPLCVMLAGSRVGTVQALSCANMEADPAAVLSVADALGDGDGRVEPSDFASIDLDGNQVHQMDDQSGNMGANGGLLILAFVADDAPVEFKTSRGVFVPAGSPAPGNPHPTTDEVDNRWRCDTEKGSLTEAEDEDCDGDGEVGDGVVVVRLRARYGDSIASTGPGAVAISQSLDRATIQFRVVGEPRAVSFITLESVIQNGVSDLDDDGKLSSKGECPLAGDAAGFIGANGTAERSLVLAIVKDKDGNAITGAIINWKTDDPDKAVMASGLTPTLDLGAFGFGAPNIICATENPGEVTLTAETARDVVLGTTNLDDMDPEAKLTKGTFVFTVLGAPASMTLAAAPAQIACDGKSSSKVTATVVGADGKPVAAGQEVRFDVKVLGTANPIVAKTDAAGVASSTITPLAGGVAGVPVTVTAGTVQQAILVACGGTSAPAPQASPAPPTGGTAPVSGAAGASTRPSAGLPRSGDGMLRGSSTLPVWALVALAIGAVAMTLSATAMVRTKRR